VVSNKISCTEIGPDDVNWIHVVWHLVDWWELVKMVMNHLLSERREISSVCNYWLLNKGLY
jgi:hypothetical protein